MVLAFDFYTKNLFINEDKNKWLDVTPTSVPLAISGNPGPGGVITSFFYKGLVDEFRLSNVARTEEEIKAAMDPASPVEPMNKLAYKWSDIKAR
ncbi:hypothetical protein GF312_02455 [Candidatus Poribacteria bacterium]|nr:hypothetical protein [Candidatus Poribacteria bacterium]